MSSNSSRPSDSLSESSHPPQTDAVLRDYRGAPIYDDVLWRYQQETGWQRFKRRFKEYPTLYLGFAAGVGVLTYAIRNYKRRRLDPNLRVKGTDQYILQVRVLTQGAIVGFITLGAFYEMFKQYRRRSQPTADVEPNHVITAAEARRAALDIDLGPPPAHSDSH